jgi:hypothetical protein
MSSRRRARSRPRACRARAGRCSWPGAPERVELGHAAGERWVHVGRRSLVEAGVGHGDDLAVALVLRAVDDDAGVQDGARDVVEQLPGGDGLDVVDLVERRELGQLALLARQAHLPPADLQLLPDRRRAGIDVVVQNDVDLARLARRRPRDGGGEDRRRGIRGRGPQRRRDLEPLQVDVGPHDERQRPNRVQVARAVPAQVRVLRDVLLDLHPEPRQRLLLLVGQWTAGLDEHVVGLGGVRRLQPCRLERVGLRNRVERDAVDRDERHAPDSNPVRRAAVNNRRSARRRPLNLRRRPPRGR